MNETRSRYGSVTKGLLLALVVAGGALTGAGCAGGDAGSADETADSTATGGSQSTANGSASAANKKTSSSASSTTAQDTGAAATAPTATTASAPAAHRTGSIVPLYTQPTHPSWAAVIAAKKAHPSVPVIAVVNPNSGPGTAARSDYMNGIGQLVAAGVKVGGYVSTEYGKRPVAEVKADVDRWRNLYPQVTTIFFDEMAYQPGAESHYTGLNSYAKGTGIDFTIGNPGVDTKPGYVGTVDTILIYESAGLPSAEALAGWHTSHPRENFGIIPYGVQSLDAAFVAAAKARCGYVFVQNDGMPNPWDSLPPYFDALLAALA
jgi:hypothetical protein